MVHAEAGLDHAASRLSPAIESSTQWGERPSLSPTRQGGTLAGGDGMAFASEPVSSTHSVSKAKRTSFSNVYSHGQGYGPPFLLRPIDTPNGHEIKRPVQTGLPATQ